MKSKYYKDFNKREVDYGLDYIKKEIKNAPFFVSKIVNQTVCEFVNNEFSYDGATFVRERNKKTLFESASLVHDMFNHKGYVGYNVDLLFILIMIALDYPKRLILFRTILMLLGTWANVLRHKYITKRYKGDIILTNYLVE